VTASDKTRRGDWAVAGVQILIMLAIGAAAGAASFTHVHDLAAAHGQGGWLAWADAIVLELMSVAAGLEFQRRRRHGVGLGLPATVLGAAVALSLSAQVVQAEHSVIGITAAAVPAVGFLTMVKIALGALGHQPDQPPQPPSAADEPPSTSPDTVAPGGHRSLSPVLVPAADTAQPSATLPADRSPAWQADRKAAGDSALPDTPNTAGVYGHAARPMEPPVRGRPGAEVAIPDGAVRGGDSALTETANGSGNSSGRNRTGRPSKLDALLPAARQAAADLTAAGETVSRDRLAELLRERGYTVANAQAERLLARLGADAVAAS
jgi:uncharacterized protein DUF2637